MDSIQFRIVAMDEETYNSCVPGAGTPGRNWKELNIMFPEWTHGIMWRKKGQEDWIIFRMGPEKELEILKEEITRMTGKGLKDRHFLAGIRSMLPATQCESGLRNFG